MPLESVVAVLAPPANVPLAPEAGAVKVTTTPLTGFELLSTTVATRGFGNAVLVCVACPDPLVALILAAGDAELVRLKLAAAVAPGAEAVTLYEPAVVPAVKTGEVAFPLESVVAVVAPPAKVPVAPDVGTAKVTVTPLEGVPLVVTVATSGLAKALPTAAVCPDPVVAVIATT